ncbi:squalene synthetase-like protein [Cladophialophora chaetospira]|uniref:Squalene synthetase-like protein n=1 Tax=Cladophialophora chaetospira TaxID=386627 RepID=A0AA38XE24_9EURO|nr:squalene synthetase-like protein [Cladophialophora chaetospira]
MGPRQRAQARKKKNGGTSSHSPAQWSQHHSPSPSPWSEGSSYSKGPNMRHRGLVNDWQDFSGSSAPRSMNSPFSMAQAAKNTERHAMAWGSSKLREQSITFVSAGNLRQEEINAAAEDAECKQKDMDSSRAQSYPLPDRTHLAEPSSTKNEPYPLPDRTHVPEPSSSKNEPSSTCDASASERLIHGSAPRRDSVSSQSSEEILFAGRGNPTPRSVAKLTPATSKPTTPSPEKQVDEIELVVGSQIDTTELAAQDSSSSGLEKFKNILSSPRNKGADRRGRARLQKKDDEENLINDYIANMNFDDDWDNDIAEAARSVKTGRRTEHFRFFDGASESKVNLRPNHSLKSAAKPKIDQAIDWDSADLADFDDFSTTDEEVVEISQVLRSRTRPSGLQYLVSAGGEVATDPRWVLHKKLTSASAAEEIRIFEDIQIMKISETTPASDDSESDLDELEEDLEEEIESEDAENEKFLKHVSRMTDEEIARALAKQEELGMGGDELLLLDGNVDDYDDDDDMDGLDQFATADGFVPFSVKTHLSNRTTSKRNRRQRDTFPSASAFADALDQDPYGAFDIMDFDRPSLRPKKKGRKSDLPFELGVEDPELAERLRSTWEKDREKKTARKREKQMDREDALLEAAERNQPGVIRAEIRQFMIQEVETLELAPMDAPQRAAIHRLAKSLKLISKSIGKDGNGMGRYTVLTKGPHTPRFTLNTIWEIDALLESRKFFPKGVFGAFRSTNTPRTRGAGPGYARRGGGGTMSGATYSNGDVVGASAPELGAENKGRAMLERMGWSVGQGIGAVGNQGSIEVIKHVVRTTKAGLG